ncbi:MAG: hypothetical protein LUD72_07450 [Bacteroidales bacterium]|nr:hypothetical protein [Bacteroidales bacterium]
MTEFTTNIYIFILVLSVLFVVRETTRFTTCLRELRPYEADTPQLVMLWLFISYIITVVIQAIH